MPDDVKVVSIVTREAYEGPGGEPEVSTPVGDQPAASAYDVEILSMILDMARSGKTAGLIAFVGIVGPGEDTFQAIETFSTITEYDRLPFIGQMEVKKTMMVTEEIFKQEEDE